MSCLGKGVLYTNLKIYYFTSGTGVPGDWDSIHHIKNGQNGKLTGAL